MRRDLLTSLAAVLACTALFGLAYPLVVTGVAQVAFGTKADGDPALIAHDTKGDPRYFQPRPSATDYSADATAFANRGPNQASAAAFYRRAHETNVHLARALRFRWSRWDGKELRPSDGLVKPPEEALAAISEHMTDKRSFSPTALQNFAACPYRFLLSAIHKLAPREDPDAIEDMDPLTKGSLVHCASGPVGTTSVWPAKASVGPGCAPRRTAHRLLTRKCSGPQTTVSHAKPAAPSRSAIKV